MSRHAPPQWHHPAHAKMFFKSSTWFLRLQSAQNISKWWCTKIILIRLSNHSGWHVLMQRNSGSTPSASWMTKLLTRCLKCGCPAQEIDFSFSYSGTSIFLLKGKSYDGAWGLECKSTSKSNPFSPWQIREMPLLLLIKSQSFLFIPAISHEQNTEMPLFAGHDP